MATDFRKGRAFPRSGRAEYGGYFWLLRVFDKARAAGHRTLDGYLYPCPMDRAVFKRWGITARQFSEAVRSHTSDEAILTWMDEHVTDRGREAANRWVRGKAAFLNRQDYEERVPGATKPPIFPYDILLSIVGLRP